MKVDFYKARWSALVLFPTIEVDLKHKEVGLIWLWFEVILSL